MKLKNIAIIILVWLTLEIVLSFLGLDHLADYGEFTGTRNVAIFGNPVVEV